MQEEPANDYWDHVDFIVNKANLLGLTIGILPTWGDKWVKIWGAGPEVFTPANAEVYGEWLGRRYKDKNLVWILGGDRPVETETHRSIIRAMAKGLRAGDGGTHLMTFHPRGNTSSSRWFHDEPWLDFNMRQNGHVAEYTERYSETRADYDRQPSKPILDGEPIYEDHPVSFKAADLGHSISGDVRRPLYWDLFSVDYRPVFRALADGLRTTGNAPISFHPQKASLQSGDWFHSDAWLTFNSVQLWPESQIETITRDWNAVPTKPTRIFEGRYEGYWKHDYKESDWGEWQMRQQAWQTVFAGAFGHTYGHERVFGFGRDGVDWKMHVDSPGARSMTHFASLMRSLKPSVALDRVPDQSLVFGDDGHAERLKSNRITASRTSDGSIAMIYVANGRTFKVRMDGLAQGPMSASWFNPRTGLWHVDRKETDQRKSFAQGIESGAGASEYEFDPPGEPIDENDWVLVIASPKDRSIN